MRFPRVRRPISWREVSHRCKGQEADEPVKELYAGRLALLELAQDDTVRSLADTSPSCGVMPMLDSTYMLGQGLGAPPGAQDGEIAAAELYRSDAMSARNQAGSEGPPGAAA
ncbi:hypothetical protein C6P46_006943 [Rhodotorula mucilaginosa]|uniref:Uncharacterized protein n=1 Tax=Rhodotorula mucilaginosa TaxID=5537 RepID=A0A9P6VXH1_RHOMI|nr:hypothetical protein C6P46_006943 [Rhodotorula mucilaginosa]